MFDKVSLENSKDNKMLSKYKNKIIKKHRSTKLKNKPTIPKMSAKLNQKKIKKVFFNSHQDDQLKQNKLHLALKLFYTQKFTSKNKDSLEKMINQNPQIQVNKIFSQNQKIRNYESKNSLKTQQIKKYIESVQMYNKYQSIIIIQKEFKYYAICCLNQLINIYEITNDEAIILAKRYQIMKFIIDQQKQFEQLYHKQQILSQVSKQNLILLYLYQNNRKILLQKVQKIKSQISKSLQKNKEQESQIINIQNNYDHFMKLSIIKNYIKGFDSKAIDYFNYFLQFQRQLFEKSSQYNQIQNKDQLKQYLRKRKPKVGKADKFTLQSACTVCLSHSFDKSNKFLSCKQCHFRFHELCYPIQKSCDRCNYKRLTKQIKDKVSQCFICGQEGLMIKKLNANKFAHIFCLISHNLWDINDGKIVFKTNVNIKQWASQTDECSYCLKRSNSFFLQNCINCLKPIHPMCGFLSGCNIQVEQLSCNLILSINCCNKEKLRISKDRKFKLNYKKCVFRDNGIGQNLNKNH